MLNDPSLDAFDPIYCYNKLYSSPESQANWQASFENSYSYLSEKFAFDNQETEGEYTDDFDARVQELSKGYLDNNIYLLLSWNKETTSLNDCCCPQPCGKGFEYFPTAVWKGI